MNEPAVLLISQDAAWIKMAEGLIREVGSLGVAVVGGLDKAYAFQGWDRVALVLVQQGRSEPTSGVARLFRMLAASRRPIATVVLGEELDEEAELELLRRGAADCLSTPYDLDRLFYLIETLTLRARQPGIARSPAEAGESVGIWDDSDPLIAQARRIAAQDATVLIRGETGTGKSRLARIIHELSPRKRGPLVTLRCGALTSEGFEEELFGGPEGPGRSSAVGKLESAREGTLVLDDIEALSPTAQVALLRWVEDGSRESSGRLRGRPNRPRIVATTRIALGDSVAAGNFRSDLFFRLNVIGLELPPLRQRRVEIVSIGLGLLTELSGRSVSLSPESIAAIEAHSWPGNVRELRDVLDAAATEGREVIELEHMPEAVRLAGGRAPARREMASAEGDGTATLAEAKREAEFHRITQALQRNANNRLRTASELGISRMTLYKKLYKYGIIEPTGMRQRRSPGRSRGPETHRGPDDSGESSPRASAGAGDTPGGDSSQPSRTAPQSGGGRYGKSAPALH